MNHILREYKSFNPNGKNIRVIGKRGFGKTTIIKDFIKKLRNKTILIFSFHSLNEYKEIVEANKPKIELINELDELNEMPLQKIFQFDVVIIDDIFLNKFNSLQRNILRIIKYIIIPNPKQQFICTDTGNNYTQLNCEYIIECDPFNYNYNYFEKNNNIIEYYWDNVRYKPIQSLKNIVAMYIYDNDISYNPETLTQDCIDYLDNLNNLKYYFK
jgi:hypothetical protein